MSREDVVAEIVEATIDWMTNDVNNGDSWALSTNLTGGFKGFENFTDEELIEEYFELFCRDIKINK